jgi:hypothetical protein
MYHEPAGADTKPPREWPNEIAEQTRRLDWSASNFGVALAEKTSMQVLLRARETEPDDDDQPAGRAANNSGYQPAPRALFCLRCFACAGTGKLWVTHAACPGGQPARCVACHGTGRVKVRVT